MSKFTEYVNEKLKTYKEDIDYFNDHVIDKVTFRQSIINTIIKLSNEYANESNIEVKQEISNRLERYYSLLRYVNKSIHPEAHPNDPILRDSELDDVPTVFVVQQLPELFDIDQDILDSIDFEEGLTEEQAQELLKWDVNSARANLNRSILGAGPEDDLYNGYHLQGSCGFSQFLSLYPLEKLGLEVTKNNLLSFKRCNQHSFGTVFIPIKQGDTIVRKQYLIDCTYSQFFQIKFNSIGRYFSDIVGANHSPSVGFYINSDPKYIEFAKQLLRDGFVELTDETAEYYFKPFVSSGTSFDEINNIDAEYDSLDIPKILKEDQIEYDEYNEETETKYGYVFDSPFKNNRKAR